MNSFSQIVRNSKTWLLQSIRFLVSEFLTFLRRNKYGVMGTIAFHMVLLILMLLFKLNTQKTFHESEISIEIPLELSEQLLQEEKERMEDALEEKKSEISKSVDELLRSIAVNQELAKSKKNPQQKVDQMIDDIRKDLNELGSDDAAGGGSDDIHEYLNDSIKAAEAKEKQKLLDSLESIEYSGPSSVYYSLEGRHKVYLPIPVFKCEGEGLIVVQIIVNRAGRVVQSSVLDHESGVQDNCLFDAALQASRKTRFNVSTSSPAEQVGKITYQFVRQ